MSVDRNQIYNAVINNNLKICKVLLNLGGDPNMVVPGYRTSNPDKYTLTYIALVKRQVEPELLELLCKYGGSVSDDALIELFDAYRNSSKPKASLSNIDASKIKLLNSYIDIDIDRLEDNVKHKLPQHIINEVKQIKSTLTAYKFSESCEIIKGFDAEL